MRRLHVNSAIGLLLAAALLDAPVAARAQENEPRTFGVATVSHTLQAFAFNGFTAQDSAQFGANGFGSRYCVHTFQCFFEAAVFLPAGAVVTSIQLDACKGPLAGPLEAKLVRIGAVESGGELLAVASKGNPASCSQVTQNLATPHTIDNVNSTYFVEVGLHGVSLFALDADTRFQAVRIFYQLQVSAPGAQVFNDVPPSHPFYQFVQALVAAGITSGCNASPPLYCPDDPVTRGQMAVFFSRALGLHFAP